MHSLGRHLSLLFLPLAVACNWIGTDNDGDGLHVDIDCNDLDPDVGEETEWWPDLDGDGRGAAGSTPIIACAQPLLHAPNRDDCNDSEPAVPADVEVPYNGLDDDCDSATLDDDLDGDGFGEADDCDDGDPSIHPGVDETCGNNIDDDCDGAVDCETGDTGLPPLTLCYPDLDGDGYGFGPVFPVQGPCAPGYVTADGDCNDTDPDVNPGATDVPGNFRDEDCNLVDACYVDADGDGFGSDVVVDGIALSCNFGFGTATQDLDCDDGNEAVHPGAAEICDGLDTDCFGGPGSDEVDADGDGFRECSGLDCNDFDETQAFPFDEDCSTPQFDEDCDGDPTVQSRYLDLDGDGWGSERVEVPCGETFTMPVVSLRGDCDDTNEDVNPAQVEIPGDALDNDCDGTKSCFVDADGDGVGSFALTTAPACTDPGVAEITDDCDDQDASVSPFAVEIFDPAGVDENCDGLVACPSDADQDGFGAAPLDEVAFCHVDNLDDCDDNDGSAFPGAAETCNGIDDDCDGIVPTDELDDDGDGFVVCPWTGPAGTQGEDCDDADPSAFPGAIESPGDGVDQDCDGVDHCFPDNDDDGHGLGQAVASSGLLCDQQPGWASATGDCDDQVAVRFPGNPEVCDGIDNDCDSDVPLDEQDVDGDGVPTCLGDCDDNDHQRAPTFTEDCGNGIDENCDGTDEAPIWYPDTDQDGFGDVDHPTAPTCTQPPGTIAQGGDCDDNDADIHPGATEVPGDSVDDDCDGLVACYADQDGDGAGAGELVLDETCAADANDDCDDTDPDRAPGLLERCDGRDNNCDGVIPSDEIDGDADGFVTCTTWEGAAPIGPGDCDDGRADTHPGATEACDGRDNDCNGTVPADEVDSDGDGGVACEGWSGSATLASGDCDDTDPFRRTGLAEVCDGRDNDCSGAVGLDELDSDGDGYVSCEDWTGDPALEEGDCDDTDADASPVGVEVAGDGIDQDCSGNDSCFVDSDNDSFGAGGAVEGVGLDCNATVGSSSVSTDCDDILGSVFPGAIEACNGIDDDCDGSADADEVDLDGDGSRVCGGDCDDTDASAYPGATEICGNDIDEDCDGNSDGASWYDDVDGDSFGDPATLETGCTVPPGKVTVGGDCDDARSFVNPLGTEVAGNDIDEDCSGDLACYQDSDGDTYGTATLVVAASCTGVGVSDNADDCDDGASNRNPGTSELCDGVDNDCNGTVPADEVDTDGDGRVSCVGWTGPTAIVSGDCEPNEPTIYTGAPEVVADGIDQDCNGGDVCYRDDDNDDFGTSTTLEIPGLNCAAAVNAAPVDTDCDDGEPERYPGNTEVCDELDNDCNDLVDDGVTGVDWWIDDDGDGFGDPMSTPERSCTPVDGRVDNDDDCNDLSEFQAPGRPEVCDGLDNDCDPGTPEPAEVRNLTTGNVFLSLNEAALESPGGASYEVCGTVDGGNLLGANEVIGIGNPTIRAFGSTPAIDLAPFSSVSVHNVRLDATGAGGIPGAGITVPGGASATLSHVEIFGANAAGSGGCAFVEGTLAIDHVEFRDCHAEDRGGALYCEGCGLDGSDLTIARGTAGVEGGGLFVDGGAITLETVVLDQCDAEAAGAMSINNVTTVTFTGLEVTNSTSSTSAVTFRGVPEVNLNGTVNFEDNITDSSTLEIISSQASILGLTITGSDSAEAPLRAYSSALDCFTCAFPSNSTPVSSFTCEDGSECQFSNTHLTDGMVSTTQFRVSDSSRVDLTNSTIDGTVRMGVLEDASSSMCAYTGNLWWSSPASAPDIQLHTGTSVDLSMFLDDIWCTNGSCTFSCP